MAVVDASVWVARFCKSDKFHEQAKNIFEFLDRSEETISIPVIAFTEVAGVIKRTTKDNGAASAAIYEMKEMEMKVFTDFDKLEPLATDIAIKYSVKGMDACYLAVAELTKSKLYTFDQQQKEAFEIMVNDKWLMVNEQPLPTNN